MQPWLLLALSSGPGDCGRVCAPRAHARAWGLHEAHVNAA